MNIKLTSFFVNKQQTRYSNLSDKFFTSLPIVLLLVYCATLVFLSLNPWLRPDPGQAVGEIGWDKIDHLLAYCLFSGLMMSAFRFNKHRRQVVVMVLLVSSSLGVLLEYCQLWFTSTRLFSYDDAIANSLGAMLGVTLFCGFRSWVSSRI